jgi:hypothetical protein
MRSRFLLLTVSFLVPRAALHADGLIQTPEVGEYVMYDMLAVPIQEGEQADLAEIHGTLRVACVGIEQDQDATSRWIEADVTFTEGDSPEIHFVFKLLVPDAGVDDPEALLPITRGWVRMEDGGDVTEIAPDRIALYHPSFVFMQTVLALAEETEEAASERTIEIDGEQLTLSTSVSGQFATLSQSVEQTATMTLSGEGTWWPHAEHAYAPAAELIWTMTLGDDTTPPGDRATKGIAFQLTATETGEDAVSSLPESN